MISYEIIMTPDSEEDLIELGDYIAKVLLAPQTAINYIREIKKGIKDLKHFPKKYKIIQDEPFYSLKIHRFVVNNFYIYYRIDEEEKIVYILNVIYNKRNQLKVLKDKFNA